jgi:hypothetical protein
VVAVSLDLDWDDYYDHDTLNQVHSKDDLWSHRT